MKGTVAVVAVLVSVWLLVLWQGAFAGQERWNTTNVTELPREMQLRIKHWYIHVCNVVDYGAKGDGLYDSTKAIQFAIGVCAHRATAKRRAAVYVPAGVAAFRDNDDGSGNDDAEGDVIVVRSLQGRTHSVDESVFENDDSDSSNGESARRADGHENVSLGVFRSGPLWLASNVDFIIDGKLVAIADLSMYPRNLRRTRGTNKVSLLL